MRWWDRLQLILADDMHGAIKNWQIVIELLADL